MGSKSSSSSRETRSQGRKALQKRRPTYIRRWSGEGPLSNERALEFEKQTYLRVCEGMDTPRSLSCYLLAQANEWVQLVELPEVTLSLNDFSQFSADYVCSEMMKKNPRIPLGIDRSAVAIQNFINSEEQCRRTNERFKAYRVNAYQHHEERERISRVSSILHGALGSLSPSKLERMERSFRYGPGSTSALTGRDNLLSKKYTCQGQVSPRLQPYVRILKGIHTESTTESLTHASKVVTVPKNAKTDRTICIEPHYNLRYQLGVGTLLRDCLKRLGLEPDDQERNRKMASTAWIDGYATIDLSAASDTISKQVVLDLLPQRWFELLHIGRTDMAVLPNGSSVVLEKFSAMGNGYTWELESLIFWAVCRSLTEKPIGVFGDDLIVPIEIVEDLFEALNFFGFKVNSKKSHWQGDFRESCGSDFYRGRAVRPFFLRKESEGLVDLTSLAIHVSNGIHTLAHRLGGELVRDVRLQKAYLYATGYARKVKTFISLGYGDDGLIVSDDDHPKRPVPKGYQGNYGFVYSRRPIKSNRTDELGAYLAALDKGSPDMSRLYEYERGALGRPSLRRMPVFDWCHLGPWSDI